MAAKTLNPKKTPDKQIQHDVPFTKCFSDDDHDGKIYLPKVINNSYDEGAYVPSIAYILGYFNSTTFSLAVDTGSGRSLMSKTFWDGLDSYEKYELEPYLREFKAVNKTRINCHGSVMIQLMLLGKEKNYVNINIHSFSI